MTHKELVEIIVTWIEQQVKDKQSFKDPCIIADLGMFHLEGDMNKAKTICKNLCLVEKIPTDTDLADWVADVTLYW